MYAVVLRELQCSEPISECQLEVARFRTCWALLSREQSHTLDMALLRGDV